jgi:hypothetical protein
MPDPITNPSHDLVVEYLYDTYYKDQGKDLDEVRTRILNDRSKFDSALKVYYQDNYANQTTYDDFKSRYTSKYGSPF